MNHPFHWFLFPSHFQVLLSLPVGAKGFLFPDTSEARRVDDTEGCLSCSLLPLVLLIPHPYPVQISSCTSQLGLVEVTPFFSVWHVVPEGTWTHLLRLAQVWATTAGPSPPSSSCLMDRPVTMRCLAFNQIQLMSIQESGWAFWNLGKWSPVELHRNLTHSR